MAEHGPKYKRGAHGNRGEAKAIVLAEILKGITVKSEIRSVVRRRLFLKNGRDVSYHLQDLARIGIITEKGNCVSLKIEEKERERKDAKKTDRVGKVVEMCKILASNKETGEAILPAIMFLTDWSADFITDRMLHLLGSNEAESLVKVAYDSAVKNINELKKEGLDVLKYTGYLGTPEAIDRNVRTILYAMEQNTLIDWYIGEGITDPPFEFHADFMKTNLKGIRKGAYGIYYFDEASGEKHYRRKDSFARLLV